MSQIPISVSDIPTGSHPVKIGLSDAYYIDQQSGPGSKSSARVNITVKSVWNFACLVVPKPQLQIIPKFLF